jgi:hypothetical protein
MFSFNALIDVKLKQLTNWQLPVGQVAYTLQQHYVVWIRNGLYVICIYIIYMNIYI